MTAAAFHIEQTLGSRERQEDEFGLSARDGADLPYLVVIADGMGGHAGGEIASRLAVRHFIAGYEASRSAAPPRRLREALDAANAAILAAVNNRPDLEGMGTTLVAVVRDDGKLFYISIGDSILWRLGRNGLERINADHSFRAVLAAQGASPERIERHAQRNQLLAALGDDELDMVDCPETSVALAPGELLVLATDGIETLPVKEIADLIADAGMDPAGSVRALLNAVREAGHPQQDNTTIAVWRPSPHENAESGWPGWSARSVVATLLGIAVLLVVAAFAMGPAIRWIASDQTDTSRDGARAVIPPASPSEPSNGPIAGGRASERPRGGGVNTPMQPPGVAPVIVPPARPGASDKADREEVRVGGT